MHDSEDWPSEPVVWMLDSFKNLTTTSNLAKREPEDVGNTTVVNLSDILVNSDKFPIDFPVESVRCRTLKEKVPVDILEKNINSAYPVVHEKALFLFSQFLTHVKKFGTPIERELYKNANLEILVDRLLKKRAVVFCGPFDKYMLLDGFTRVGKWKTVGTTEEQPPLILEESLSYDEIKLSALLSVSSYTHFVNDGNRNNCGRTSSRENVEDEGIIIGMIGARFEKRGVMEYQDIVITKEQNHQGNGYGEHFIPTRQGLFINFYGEPCLTYSQLEPDLKNTKKYTKIRNEQYFNKTIYERRLALSIDTLLLEANGRAKERSKMAYVHVVGFGLGVWRIAQCQDEIFMNTFAKRIRFLGKALHFIADICFSYIDYSSCGKYGNGDIIPVPGHPDDGIKLHILKRNPHEKLKGPDQGKLLVVSYAWDGNSLPGNEFWWGQLSASGDPACAASTQVAELHNPHINPKICGANLRVVTFEGVVPFKEYVAKRKGVGEK